MSTTRLRVGDFGDAVAQLQERLRQEGHAVSADEQKRKFFGPTTREAVGKFQSTRGLDPTCDVCERTAAQLSSVPQADAGTAVSADAKSRISAERALGKARSESGGSAVPASGAVGAAIAGSSALAVPANGEVARAKVFGTIALEHGSPASQVKVRLYQRGFGGTKILLNEVETDQRGAYAIPYSVGGPANVEVYAVSADGREVQLSQTKFGAQPEERIDLIAPSKVQPASAEFDRLKAALAPHTGNDLSKLKDALERGGRRDFSYLAGVSGWDAGSLALASEALNAEANTKIPSEGLYALARAGVPMDFGMLANVSKQTIARALRQAAEAGIVDASVVDKSVQAFGEFAAEHRFSNSIRGALSSPKAFVAKARVSDEDRVAFARVVRDERTDDFWARAQAEGVSDAGIQKLQLQGKLAYLTFNNAELADYLGGKVSSDPLELIALGFYDAEKWKAALRELAGSDAEKLGASVPPVFSGRTLEERVEAYTTELARRVRQMDPHAVTVDRIATGRLAGVAEKDGVGKFLKNAAALGFRLGKTPLRSFVAKNEGAVWNGISVRKDDVLSSVSTLSVLYSTSPNDEALSGLLLAGFTSATAIAKYDYSVFADRLEKFLPGPKGGDQEVTRKIFWKAQQQSATVFNVFNGLKRLNTLAYAPGSTPGDAKKRDDQIIKLREKLTGSFPTLETLFGSVDYCECNHCQSVLSPAAYLVDLLKFVDPSEDGWTTVKASYQARTGSVYAKRKPFDVLNDRRPDIKNIALTCENTNTALPYIDIVNEVLEQLMMADQTPAAIEAYDVGEASSQDLIAEPQNLLWSAYVGAPGRKGLRDLVYPVTLPMDLPLEMVRALLKQLDLPLWRLREYVARPSALAPTANGRTDGWTDVWFERLGLGASDVSALIRSDKWFELFGYDSEPAALEMVTEATGTRPAANSLRNGKTLARRLSVTYEELVELVRTRFINPHVEHLIVLKRLGVDPNTIDRYFGEGTSLSDGERTGLEADLLSQNLAAGELAPLRTEAIRKATIMLQSPSVGCDFAKTILGFDQEPADAEQAIGLVLRRMNAFVRLQKKLGWETHELDRTLMAVMPDATSVTMATWPDAMRSALIYLAHVEELRERFQDRVSREEIVGFWSDIPTVGMSCLYERLFLSPGASGRNPAFRKRLGRVLEGAAVPLNEHVDAIRQAFQLAHDEIEPVLTAAGASNRLLSVQNLSILMRYSALAKGLDLSIADLLALLSLSERRPLSLLAASPLADLAKDVPWSETLAFVREVELTKEAGVDVAFLERICRHRGIVEQPLAEKDPVLVALAALPPMDPTAPEKLETLVVQTLAAQLSAPETIVDKLIGGVLKDSASRPLKEAGFAGAVRTAESLRRVRKALALVQSLGITDGELDYVTGVVGALSPNDLPVEDVADDTIARSLRKGLTAWLELAAARKQFGRSERLLAVLQAARQPIDSTNTASAREKQLQEAMAGLTGLKLVSLSPLLDAIGAKSAGGSIFEVAALAEPSQLRRVIEALKCFTRLGLNPKDVVQFASTIIDDSVARRIRSSVKARYAPSAWRRLAKPIFDGLRKKQRDALVAHLTHVREGESAKYGETMEMLFEYLLLDPGMEPVVVASRIQLAIASVQLFVQRCLMNLEEGVDPQIIDNKRWEWMRRYRVWEVNRKMFIWPENWLDPEFRDDKTHLFRDLEGKLLQGDVNDDLVRAALYSYLKGLEEIARLEMLTMYFEPGASADGSTVHVVGRTPNAPHKYFCRKASHGMWTPWEPIDVGIEGEHLVLTAWRGRMHLFWVSLLEQTEENPNIPLKFEPSKDSVGTSNLRGVTKVKVQLHWVEQVQGKWVNRSSTPNFVDTDFGALKATSEADKRSFFVRAVVIGHDAGVEDDDLEIQITRGSKAHKFAFFSKLAPPRSETIGSLPPEPPFGVSPSATKWRGDGSLQVSFVSAVTQHSETGTHESGNFHKILGGGEGFALLFPSNEALPVATRTPPAGVGRPAGYTFRPQNAQHVAYRAGDGSIHDLFWTKNGWFYQSPSLDAASSSSAVDTEPANSDPHGYAVDERGTICIAYAGSTKLHELVWSQLDGALDDAESLGTGWRIETLYKAANAADQPQGRPFGGIFLPDRGVVFRTRDGRLRGAVEPSAGASWEIRDFNATLPKAASDPTGLLMTKTEVGITSAVSRHIFYLGTDGNVHELRSDASGLNWTYTNITQGMGAIVKPAPGSTPAAYAFLGQNTLHVVYRGTDDRIHELWGYPGSWNYNSTGANFTKAKGDPTGYVTESYGTQHVVYRGDGDEVVELWWGNARRENILTKSTSGAPKSGSNVAGYSFESFRTQHVVYFDADGGLRELWWNADGWHTGSYELKNPFPDALGPLASPFFYESSRKDHAFFVEPYVVETAVHEWTEWIVTTQEYVEVQLGYAQLIPLNPYAIAVAPSDVGIIKNLDRFKEKLFDERVIMRTPRGVIGPRADALAEVRRVAPVLADTAPRVVDVRRGDQFELNRARSQARLEVLR